MGLNHSENNATGVQLRDKFHSEALAIDFDRLLPAMRRQAAVAAGACVLAMLAGTGWILTLVPRYTANTLILLDHKRIRPVEEVYDVNAPGIDDAGSVLDSQVEVLKSENVAISVIRKLDSSEPELNVKSLPKKDLFSRLRQSILQSFGGPAPASGSADGQKDSDQARLHYAADLLRSNMDIRRVPRTMVLQVAYTSPDPVKAARIANAYAEAYLADQLNAKYEATKRASDWLEQRMSELKQKAVASDLAVQKYREEHNLITSGGRLVNEQQLNEINSQLILARAETARAEARYQRIESIIRERQTGGVVSEAIGNTVIAQLRTKYLDTSKRESEISAKLGKDHILATSLREEMREYDRLMFAELGRLAESYRSDLQIAKSKEDSLTASLQKSEALNASENKVLVGLHELEREGDAYQKLYQSYLKRYHEALQQQTFPIIDARIITSASPPPNPSHPKKTAILLLFSVVGSLAGIAIAFYREFRERGFASEEQVKGDLGLECLGILPLLPQQLTANEQGACTGKGPMPLSAIIPIRFPWKPPPEPRSISGSLGIVSYALDNPRSGFSETLFAVKLAADVILDGNSSKIIGVVSSLPGEGKSVFAKNLGSILAKLGAKALLIDADLRAQTLTHWTAPKARAGLVEAAIQGQPLEDLFLVEERSGLSILPTVMHARPSNTAEFLASAGMKGLLKRVSAHFDYVVIDLPPLGPVVDARAIAPQVGAFVLVVEWRRTARKVVRSILSNESEIYRKCLGVVLNKVNVSELKRFETYGSKYFYYNEYANSYYKLGENEQGLKRPVSNTKDSFETAQEPKSASNVIENQAHS
jgi:polysaccharide biosynthesis transport protein